MVIILLYAYVKEKFLQHLLGFLFWRGGEKNKKSWGVGRRENSEKGKVRARRAVTALGKSPIFGNLRVDRLLSMAVHAVHRHLFPERFRGLAC
jgi:hypothetical protein